MNIMIDWEYYNTHYPKVNEQRFNELRYQATRLVSLNVNDVDVSEDEESLVKDCICSVINIIDEQNFGLKSISNDGYSKTFESSTHSDFNKQIQSLISMYLGGTRLCKSHYIGY